MSVVGAAALTLILWASVYSAVKVGLDGFSPWQLAFLRLAVASIALGIYAALTQSRLPHRRHWLKLALIGFVGFALYLVLLNSGQRTVVAGTASFIINATPALSAMLAALFLKESLRPLGIIGIAISFCGVSLMVVSGGHGWRFEFSLGALILVLAAIAHAMHFVLQKASLHDVSPFQVTLLSIWTGTACLLPVAPETISALSQASWRSIGAVLYLGIFPSALAYFTWAFVLTYMSATLATSLLALIPPLAVAIGALWLGELPTLMAFCGGAVAIGGVALVQIKGQTSK